MDAVVLIIQGKLRLLQAILEDAYSYSAEQVTMTQLGKFTLSEWHVIVCFPRDDLAPTSYADRFKQGVERMEGVRITSAN